MVPEPAPLRLVHKLEALHDRVLTLLLSGKNSPEVNINTTNITGYRTRVFKQRRLRMLLRIIRLSIAFCFCDSLPCILFCIGYASNGMKMSRCTDIPPSPYVLTEAPPEPDSASCPLCL